MTSLLKNIEYNAGNSFLKILSQMDYFNNVIKLDNLKVMSEIFLFYIMHNALLKYTV